VLRLDREQAISVGVLVLLLLACLLSAGLTVQVRWDAGSELAEHRELLSRLETRMRAEGTRSRVAAPPSAFLDASTPAIASAKLQTYLTQLVDLQHGGIVSSGGEATKRDEATDTIRLQATIDMNMQALRAILFQLETGTPYVFVDALAIQPASVSAGRSAEDPLLRATMSLRAFWRQATPP
jgi:general secretion pathway protein M